MIDIIKRVEKPKERLMLECECGSVIIFDDSDIKHDFGRYFEDFWYFDCPVCGKRYGSDAKQTLESHFTRITEEDAKIKTKNILRGLE